MEIKRCSRCILPATYPDIAFDENNVCNICRGHNLPNYKEKEQEFKVIADYIKKKGRKYDCLIPLSGGKDSVYCLYLAKKFGLKILAMNLDNGFQTEIAEKNMQEATRILDVDFVCHKIDLQITKKVYSIFFSKAGELCTPCRLGTLTPTYRFALKERIPLILHGWDPGNLDLTPCMILSDWHKLMRESYGSNDAKIIREMFPSIRITLKGRLASIKCISMPQYFNWNLKKIEQIISNELNWEKGDGFEHFDCKLAPIKDYLLRKKWGFSEVTCTLAALVRSGQITRDEALKEMYNEEKDPDESRIREFANTFNMSSKKVEEYSLQKYTENKSVYNFLWWKIYTYIKDR